MSDYRVTSSGEDQDHNGDENIRDIHALTPSFFPPPIHHPLRSSQSIATSEWTDFSYMSANNSTLVLAGSMPGSNRVENNSGNNQGSIREDNDGMLYPLAPSPIRGNTSTADSNDREVEVSLRSVKRQEVESKITAWKNAKIAEISNRFKCEDAIINGRETEQAQKANLQMKKIERKLEEKRARAVLKMENVIAKAYRKAEEKRASAEAKRAIDVARVLEVSNLMKAVGRSPAKHTFF